jgi:hypothetical protein
MILWMTVEFGAGDVVAALGSDHPSTAMSFNNLALLYKSHDKYDLAEPLYLPALAITERRP